MSKTLASLFSFTAARSQGIEDYEGGKLPFVTSAELNNGVVTYVQPEDTDLVFDGPAIAISGLGHATVHLGKFLPKGNGGDSLTILRPLGEMTVEELVAAATAFNVVHKWRFSYGRKCSVDRLKMLEIDWPLASTSNIWKAETDRLLRVSGSVAASLLKGVPPAPLAPEKAPEAPKTAKAPKGPKAPSAPKAAKPAKAAAAPAAKKNAKPVKVPAGGP